MVAAGLYCVHTVMWVCPYHPEHHVDGQHGGHASERQALQDAAAGVGAEASLGGAVLLPERVQEAQNIQLRGSALPRERPARRQLGLRHQHRVIPDVRGGGGKRRGEKEACGGRGRGCRHDDASHLGTSSSVLGGREEACKRKYSQTTTSHVKNTYEC